MPVQTRKKEPHYVYDLPYSVQRELALMLDGSGEWKTLAAEIGYHPDKIAFWQLSFQQPGGSATETLLREWGFRNPTISRLYRLLHHCQIYRPLNLLQKYVPQQLCQELQVRDTGTVNLQPAGGFQRDDEYNDTTETQMESADLPRPGDVRLRNSLGKESAHVRFKRQKSNDQLQEDEAQNLDSSVYASGLDGESRAKASKLLINDLKKPLNVTTDYYDQKEKRPNPGRPSSSTSQSHMSCGSSASGKSSQISYQEAALVSCQSFRYEDIKHDTYGFDDHCLLGSGGFGKVYKATMKGTEFAIKKQTPRENADDQEARKKAFIDELTALSRYRHDNIIQLIGYSDDGPHICLVYQFMKNKSLEDRLACKEDTPPLTWIQRHGILAGAARGINYLHTISEKPLIHGDIKSANILLDRHMEPKIADFGLAKEATGGSSHTTPYTHVTRFKKNEKIYATKAYMPEEFLRFPEFNVKTDVYSFGIVIYEVCTGEKAYDSKREGGEKLKDYMDNGPRDTSLRDRKASNWPDHLWRELVNLGNLCTAKTKKERPQMCHVFELLEKMARFAEDAENQAAATTTAGMEEESYIRANMISYAGSGQGASLQGAPQSNIEKLNQSVKEIRESHIKPTQPDVRPKQPSQHTSIFTTGTGEDMYRKGCNFDIQKKTISEESYKEGSTDEMMKQVEKKFTGFDGKLTVTTHEDLRHNYENIPDMRRSQDGPCESILPDENGAGCLPGKTVDEAIDDESSELKVHLQLTPRDSPLLKRKTPTTPPEPVLPVNSTRASDPNPAKILPPAAEPAPSSSQLTEPTQGQTTDGYVNVPGYKRPVAKPHRLTVDITTDGTIDSQSDTTNNTMEIVRQKQVKGKNDPRLIFNSDLYSDDISGISGELGQMTLDSTESVPAIVEGPSTMAGTLPLESDNAVSAASLSMVTSRGPIYQQSALRANGSCCSDSCQDAKAQSLPARLLEQTDGKTDEVSDQDRFKQLEALRLRTSRVINSM